jgi:hypothetical protein
MGCALNPARNPKLEARNPESGNAFYVILIGIILFAALMFVFTQNARQGSGNLSLKEAQLDADDVLSFAQQVERGVSHVYANDCSEDGLNFDQTYVTGYTNTNAPSDGHCTIFSTTGGGIDWRAPPEGGNDGSPWIITGTDNVDASTFGTAEPDLLLILNHVDSALCTALNKSLGVSGIPTGTGAVTLTAFTGTFPATATSQIGSGDGAKAECVSQGGVNIFYSVLMPR